MGWVGVGWGGVGLGRVRLGRVGKGRVDRFVWESVCVPIFILKACTYFV